MSAFERVERREVITTETLWRKGEPEKLASSTAVTTRYTVTGADAMPLWGDGRGRLYVPMEVIVANPDDVTVLGVLQRVDGSLGRARHTIYGLSGWRGGPRRPAWLAEIVEDAAR